jgi:hypothetical protein
LWEHPPLKNARHFLSKKGTTKGSLIHFPELVTEVGAFSFAPLVDSSLGVVAELEVVILKPEGPGSVVRQGGDLDNQLKTLFDALRAPQHISELPTHAEPDESEHPLFFCLLEDDQLITRIDLSAYRWLGAPNPSHVHVDLLVRVKPSIPDTGNLIFV